MTRRRLAAVVLLLAVLLLAACQRDTPLRPPTTQWRWRAPAPAYVGMPTADARNIAATYGHSVLALLDHDGRVVWRAEQVGLRDVAPTLTATEVLAASDDGVVAFGRTDGRLRWEEALGDRASTPLQHNGRTIVTTWNGALVAIDGWSVALPGLSLGPPAVGRGVAVASWDSGVLGADVDTGQVLWRREFGEPGTSAPVVGDRVAVVVGGDRRAHAIDLRTGAERWSFATPGAGSPEAPPAVRGGLVAVVDRLGHLAVVDLRTGRRQWSAHGDGAVERGGPAFVGRTVVFPLDDGRLVVATRSGRQVVDPEARVSGVAAAGDRAVYATREASRNGLTALSL